MCTAEDGHDRWYEGCVTDVLTGEDDSDDAVHQMYYDEDEASYEADSLYSDLQNRTLHISDV